jgi:hypothetical protein
MVESDVGHDALDSLPICSAARQQVPVVRARLRAGHRHPDDPYRFVLAPELPNVAVWFPPEGLAPRLFAAPEKLRDWRPRFRRLSPVALAAALAAEATAARDVRELIEGRDIEAG